MVPLKGVGDKSPKAQEGTKITDGKANYLQYQAIPSGPFCPQSTMRTSPLQPIIRREPGSDAEGHKDRQNHSVPEDQPLNLSKNRPLAPEDVPTNETWSKPLVLTRHKKHLYPDMLSTWQDAKQRYFQQELESIGKPMALSPHNIHYKHKQVSRKWRVLLNEDESDDQSDIEVEKDHKQQHEIVPMPPFSSKYLTDKPAPVKSIDKDSPRYKLMRRRNNGSARRSRKKALIRELYNKDQHEILANEVHMLEENVSILAEKIRRATLELEALG